MIVNRRQDHPDAALAVDQDLERLFKPEMADGATEFFGQCRLLPKP